MPNDYSALAVPAALGRVEAFVGSTLAALSLRQALVLALDSSRPQAHPFAERDAFAATDGAALVPLRPPVSAGVDAPQALRFRIEERGGPTLSNNRWSLGPAATLGMHVSWTPAGERARVRTCTPEEACALAQRHDTRWWRWGRAVGLSGGPFALPIAPWTTREPLVQLDVGDSVVSHHAATLQVLPGALLGQAAGLSLAAALHLGVGTAVALGTLAGMVRLGIGLHITRPTWWGHQPLGISVTRLDGSDACGMGGAAPRLPQGDVGDVWWQIERRQFLAEDEAPLAVAHLPGESEPVEVSIAQARARNSLLEVALECDDGAPWVAPSLDVPLLTAAHVGYGWRRARRHTWLLDARRASGQLLYALLCDAQMRSELKGARRPLPQAAWEAELRVHAESASRELFMPGVDLWGMCWGSGHFAELQTIHASLQRGTQLVHRSGMASVEEVVHYSCGRRVSTLLGWGADRSERLNDDVQSLGTTPIELEWHGLFSTVTAQQAQLLAAHLASGNRNGALPSWSAPRRGLRIAVRWQPPPNSYSTQAQFLARHTPFCLPRIAADLRAATGTPRIEVGWAQTEQLFGDVRWFLAQYQHLTLPHAAAVQVQSKALSAKLRAEEAALRQDPMLGRLAPQTLVAKLQQSKALRAALHGIHCTTCV